MCVYGFNVSSDVTVEDAIIEVKRYFVIGVFLNPRQSVVYRQTCTRRRVGEHAEVRRVVAVEISL